MALLASCGGASKHAFTLTTPKPRCPPLSVVKQRLVVLHRDLALLRRIAKTVPESAQPNGSNAIALATNRFLLDESTSGVGIYVRNALINEAAAVVNTVCQPCWGSLEANRPAGGSMPNFNNQPLDCTRQRKH